MTKTALLVPFALAAATVADDEAAAAAAAAAEPGAGASEPEPGAPEAVARDMEAQRLQADDDPEALDPGVGPG